MKESRTKIALLLLSMGMLLVGLSWWFTPPKDNPSSPVENRLARVDRASGQAWIFRSGFTQKDILTDRSFVYDLDSVETDDIGEAILTFDSAYRVRVLPSSMVTLESQMGPEENQIILIIKRGDIKIENYGLEGQLYVGKNGERILASDYHDSPLNSLTAEEPAPLEELPPTSGSGSQLTDDEISSFMAKHRSSFFKCYTQALQNDPNIRGNVNLSFTIYPSGKLEQAEVTYSEILDPNFKSCLLEVAKRITFRKFEGLPVSTIYPLAFE